VGLLEIEGGFYASDIAAYENLAKISTNVVLETFPIDGYDEGPGSQLANEEVSADIEMAIAMAPGLQRVIVYEGVTYYGIDVLNTMATDNRATAAPLTRT
jgi:transcriptional/translational regulatory protein YebC/TACO1